MSRHVVGPPRDEDDFVALESILGQSLNVPDALMPHIRRRIGESNFRCVWDDGVLCGGLGVYRVGQWFGGRCIPMAGITVVGTSPESRGTGAARFLMSSVLRELAAEPTPLACLYASTQQLYRRVGFEQSGVMSHFSMPLRDIGRFPADEPIHRVDVPLEPPLDDAFLTPFRHVADERARRSNGNLARSAGLWERVFFFLEKKTHAYLIGDTKRPDGFIVYYQDRAEPWGYQLCIRDMVANTRAAANRIWRFLADHRSMAHRLIWQGSNNDPLLLFPAEMIVDVDVAHRWMSRVLDVPLVLESRGYPAGLNGQIAFDVRDELIPGNNGVFQLTVANQTARVERVEKALVPCISTDVMGFAPLFTGMFTPPTLRAMGCLDGSDEAMALASAIFAGPTPWMVEVF